MARMSLQNTYPSRSPDSISAFAPAARLTQTIATLTPLQIPMEPIREVRFPEGVSSTILFLGGNPC